MNAIDITNWSTQITIIYSSFSTFFCLRDLRRVKRDEQRNANDDTQKIAKKDRNTFVLQKLKRVITLYIRNSIKIKTFNDLNITKVKTRALYKKVEEKFKYNYDLQRKHVSLNSVSRQRFCVTKI